MNKKFIIGKKPSVYSVIGTILVCLFFGSIAGMFLSQINDQLNEYKVYLIIGVCIVAVFYYIPVVATTIKHWDVSEKYLEIYLVNSYIEKIKYVLSIFSKSEDKFATKIKLEGIESLTFYWTSFLSGVGGVSRYYRTYIGITLKDGALITVSYEFSNDKDKIELINAIEYLKANYNIEIKDENNLLEAIKDPKKNIWSYIDELEKKTK